MAWGVAGIRQTWPGVQIVLLGAPIYLLNGWAGGGRDAKTSHSQALDLQDAK